jgi:hypothetical protein
MGSEAEFLDTEVDGIEVGAAFEVEPYEGLSIVEAEEVETTLADEDEVALEEGIASVFDTILAEGFEEPMAESDPDQEPAYAGDPDYDDGPAYDDDAEYDEDEAMGDSDVTFVLLAELNRLWAQPLNV